MRKKPKNAEKIIKEYKPVPCLNCIHRDTRTLDMYYAKKEALLEEKK